MSRYYLSRDTFLCESKSHAVFLDLRRDRYLALSPQDSLELQSLLAKEPTYKVSNHASTGGPTRHTHDYAELAHLLENEGLVVRDPSLGKSSEEQSLDEPTETLWNAEERWPRLYWGHFLSLLAARVRAVALLRILPLQAVVRRVRARSLHGRTQVELQDVDDFRVLIKVFNLLEPMFVSGTNSCLKRSLTLIEFLSIYGLFPKWVFGVQVEPFSAHCWVQQGPAVLNDSLQHIKTFTPIMVV